MPRWVSAPALPQLIAPAPGASPPSYSPSRSLDRPDRIRAESGDSASTTNAPEARANIAWSVLLGAKLAANSAAAQHLTSGRQSAAIALRRRPLASLEQQTPMVDPCASSFARSATTGKRSLCRLPSECGHVIPSLARRPKGRFSAFSGEPRPDSREAPGGRPKAKLDGCTSALADGQTLAASKGLCVALTEPSAFGATTKDAGVM